MERILREINPYVGITYAYYDGTTSEKDGKEEENDVIYLDSDFNRLLTVVKNEEVDARLMQYRLKGLTVKRTPVKPSDPKNIRLKSAIWLKTLDKEKNKYRLLLIKQDAQQLFKQARKELEDYNPKNNNYYKYNM